MKKQKPTPTSQLIFLPEEEHSPGVESREKISLSPGGRLLLMGVILLGLFVLSFFFMVNVRSHLSPAWLLENARLRMEDVIHLLTGQSLNSAIHYFLIRHILAVAAGAALGCAGCVYQGVFQNRIASPTVLGIQAGGALCAAFYVALFVSPAAPTTTSMADVVEHSFLYKLVVGNATQIAILLGCFLSLALVLVVSRLASGGKRKPLTMILCGTLFNALCTTAITALQSYFRSVDEYSTRSDALGNIMTGSMNMVSTPAHLVGMGVPILLGLVLLLMLGGRLNFLTLAPEEALSMGVPLERLQVVFLTLATFVTGVVLAYCGMFCFVGLAAPNLCRAIVGDDHRYLLPASLLLGGLLTLLAYVVSYLIGLTSVMNVILAIVGGLVFLGVVLKSRGNVYG